MDTFKDRLKQLRNERNLTQKELAEYIGTTRATLASWETGRREPDMETLRKLSEYFNVSLDWLMGKTDIRDPHNLFIEEAAQKYGPRGKKQAEKLLKDVKAMFDGGELPDEDKDEFFKAITEIYFESKERNKKYTPKKYRERQ